MSIIKQDYGQIEFIKSAYYTTLTNVTGTTGTGLYTINCGFKPTKIIVVQTGDAYVSSGASITQYAFIYDVNYSTVNVRYSGGTQYNWVDYAMSGTGSTIREVNDNGFIWHQNPNYNSARIDIIAIREFE